MAVWTRSFIFVVVVSIVVSICPGDGGLVKLHQARPGALGSSHDGIRTLPQAGESSGPSDETGGCPIDSEKRCATSESERTRKCRAKAPETNRKIVQPVQDCSRHAPELLVQALQASKRSCL